MKGESRVPHSFISFCKYSWSTNYQYVPGTVLGAGNTAVSRDKKRLILGQEAAATERMQQTWM